MVQLLTYRQRHSYATKSNQHRSSKPPVGNWCVRAPRREPVAPNVLLLARESKGYNEFGTDGGCTAKELVPKVTIVKSHLASVLGVRISYIDVRYLVTTTIVLKGLGGILFIGGCSFGAYLLLLHLAFTTPLSYDFYNYGHDKREYVTLMNGFV